MVQFVISLLLLVASTTFCLGRFTFAVENQHHTTQLHRDASYGDTTKEEILLTRERRKKQLKVMVLDARKQLADHSAGEKLLSMEEKTQFENRIDLFQRKLDSMQVELEDWEIDRLVVRGTENANRRRERSQASRRITNEL